MIGLKDIFLNMYNKQECKAAGYADDISGFLKTLESIGLFFNEFEEKLVDINIIRYY
jgi:hypothetical protein